MEASFIQRLAQRRQNGGKIQGRKTSKWGEAGGGWKEKCCSGRLKRRRWSRGASVLERNFEASVGGLKGEVVWGRAPASYTKTCPKAQERWED